MLMMMVRSMRVMVRIRVLGGSGGCVSWMNLGCPLGEGGYGESLVKGWIRC